MNKYFEFRDKDGVKNGIIENIPEDVSYETIKERIEVFTETESINLINKPNDALFDIEIDWLTIDTFVDLE